MSASTSTAAPGASGSGSTGTGVLCPTGHSVRLGWILDYLVDIVLGVTLGYLTDVRGSSEALQRCREMFERVSGRGCAKALNATVTLTLGMTLDT
jgi:hypothetical protein